jgi:hypothetical protein
MRPTAATWRWRRELAWHTVAHEVLDCVDDAPDWEHACEQLRGYEPPPLADDDADHTTAAAEPATAAEPADDTVDGWIARQRARVASPDRLVAAGTNDNAVTQRALYRAVCGELLACVRELLGAVEPRPGEPTAADGWWSSGGCRTLVADTLAPAVWCWWWQWATTHRQLLHCGVTWFHHEHRTVGDGDGWTHRASLRGAVAAASAGLGVSLSGGDQVEWSRWLTTLGWSVPADGGGGSDLLLTAPSASSVGVDWSPPVVAQLTWRSVATELVREYARGHQPMAACPPLYWSVLVPPDRRRPAAVPVATTAAT